MHEVSDGLVRNMGIVTYLVVDDELDWNSIALLLQCTVHEHFVHVLSVEHVISVGMSGDLIDKGVTARSIKTHGCPHFAS